MGVAPIYSFIYLFKFIASSNLSNLSWFCLISLCQSWIHSVLSKVNWTNSSIREDGSIGSVWHIYYVQLILYLISFRLLAIWTTSLSSQTSLALSSTWLSKN